MLGIKYNRYEYYCGRCDVDVITVAVRKNIVCVCVYGTESSNWRIENETHTRTSKCIINFMECTLNMHISGMLILYKPHEFANRNNNEYAEYIHVS